MKIRKQPSSWQLCKGLSIKPGKATRSKNSSYKLSKNTNGKGRSIGTFLLIEIGSHPDKAQRQHYGTDTTPRGVAFY